MVPVVKKGHLFAVVISSQLAAGSRYEIHGMKRARAMYLPIDLDSWSDVGVKFFYKKKYGLPIQTPPAAFEFFGSSQESGKKEKASSS